jgi:GAF domain-containing protein
MNPTEKQQTYQQVRQNIHLLISGENDEIAIMATVAAELNHAFPHFNWVGFYRVIRPGILKVGPYQGGHGCLTIPFEQGVCGRCASDRATQVVDDVTRVPHHIACSGSTRSEIVVPLIDRSGQVRAVLDIDSDLYGAFDTIDQACLEKIVSDMAGIYQT